jgi:hypothetical protein
MWKKLKFNGYLPPQQGEGASPNEEWQRFVEGFDFFALIDAWRSLVGDMLANESLPLRLKNRTLFILTRHPAFADNMKYMERVLLKKIHERFPATRSMLEKLAFESNEAFFKEKARPLVKPKPATLHPHSPEYKKLRAEALALFHGLEDSMEQERWVSLYIQMCQANHPHST